jgi:hypothetical protein
LEAAVFSATARLLAANGSASERSSEFGPPNVGDVLDAMLKDDTLGEIAHYESALREQLRLVSAELLNVMNWHLENDFLRDSVGYVEPKIPSDPEWLKLIYLAN